MYKLLLAAKYLFKRRLAWVSLAAVALCTAMVLVVISVMGGWLAMYKAAFKTLSGDLIVSRPSLRGVQHYEQIIQRLEALPEIDAAVPVMRTAGLINIGGVFDDFVGVVGVPIDQIDRVFRFRETLHWQYELPKADGIEPPPIPSFDLVPGVPYEELTPNDPRARSYPGMIVGSQVVGARRDKDGQVRWPLGIQFRWARLTVVPMTDDLSVSRTITPSTSQFWIVDGSRTQLPQHDKNVYVPFDVLQRDLRLGESRYIDSETNQEMIEPARASEIHVNLKPGVDPQAVKSRIAEVVERVTNEVVDTGTDPTQGTFGGIRVQTWQEQQALWLGAIENEIALTTFLFAFISLVAVFLIFVIFYMIVIEKTRDIGIIKSVGAGAFGVAQIFLMYGGAIGIVGGAAGVALGYVIVRNINLLHSKIAEWMGFEIWNSNVYAFDYIPDRIDLPTACVIFAVAIAAAVAGSLVPAIRAAMLRPVAALRFE